MATGRSPSSVYIPLCDEAECYSWLQKIIDRLTEKNVRCQVGNPINGRYVNRFKQFLKKCDFTIIHYCPVLWRRIYALNEYILSQDEKLILLRIAMIVQERKENESIPSFIRESLDTFYQEMDSEQKISNTTDVQKFVESIMSQTLLASMHGSMESIEDTATESVASNSSHSFNDTNFSPVFCSGTNKQFDECDSGITENFEKYYDVFGLVNDMSIFVRSCDAQWISPIDFEYTTTTKLVEKINGFKTDKLQDMNYVLHKLLPMQYKEKRMVELSSIVSCKWNILRERALVLLENILWESNFGFDLNNLENIDTHLSLAMQQLTEEYHSSSNQTCLLLKEHAAHVSLIVLSNFILISGTSKEAAEKAEIFLQGKMDEFSDANEALDTSQKSLKSILTDAMRSSQIHVIANKYLLTRAQPGEAETANRLLKENHCVQIVVVFKLLRKIFCLDKEPLKFLEDYMNQTGVSKLLYKRKYSAPKACTTMIIRGITMFLSHNTRRKEHLDVQEICQQAIGLLKIAAKRGIPEELARSFLPLLFDARDFIREGMVAIIIQNKKNAQESLLNFAGKVVEHLLLPFVKNITKMPPPSQSERDCKGNFKTQPVDWNIFKIQYDNKPAKMFLHTISETDHKKQNKTYLREQKDQHYTELLNLQNLKHENIIAMLAFQTAKMPQFYILEDGHQRLQVALKNARDNQKFLAHKLLCKLLLDALKGLRYCHNQHYIHRNLTAYSLCTVNMQFVKLGEFGLCMRQARNEIAIDKNSKTIPLRWSAPESTSKGEFSSQSDICMVGHLIYEVLTHGMLPYAFITSDDIFVEALQSANLNLQKQNCLDDATFELITKCTDNEPLCRPSIEEVMTIMEEIHKTVLEVPHTKIIYPAIDADKGTSSIEYTRGLKNIKPIREELIAGSPDRIKVLGD